MIERHLYRRTIVILAAVACSVSAFAGSRTFRAHLSGDSEVPPAETKATGQAIFQLSEDGTSLSYRLIVANIDNVIASHIHMAPAGLNGGVVAFLYGPAVPGGGSENGVLATGTITDADLVGALSGQTVLDLVAAIEAGNTYVNVHTSDGIDPPNTGAGDFAGGEVRGQIE